MANAGNHDPFQYQQEPPPQAGDETHLGTPLVQPGQPQGAPPSFAQPGAAPAAEAVPPPPADAAQPFGQPPGTPPPFARAAEAQGTPAFGQPPGTPPPFAVQPPGPAFSQPPGVPGPAFGQPPFAQGAEAPGAPAFGQSPGTPQPFAFGQPQGVPDAAFGQPPGAPQPFVPGPAFAQAPGAPFAHPPGTPQPFAVGGYPPPPGTPAPFGQGGFPPPPPPVRPSGKKPLLIVGGVVAAVLLVVVGAVVGLGGKKGKRGVDVDAPPVAIEVPTVDVPSLPPLPEVTVPPLEVPTPPSGAPRQVPGNVLKVSLRTSDGVFRRAGTAQGKCSEISPETLKEVLAKNPCRGNFRGAVYASPGKGAVVTVVIMPIRTAGAAETVKRAKRYPYLIEPKKGSGVKQIGNKRVYTWSHIHISGNLLVFSMAYRSDLAKQDKGGVANQASATLGTAVSTALLTR
ncbi:hypothetical protein LO762_14320 [Actinocorallia sp. API 0066]|uniref:hypothetical protein n=1 Tax=Actinocorallia sp. API 0066 TaxID=2896846 RepID=UPI001E320446|nr:hypothetical protein [Actinocorallia sp. API 0066]MCD0450358.1 hypothetical protein [Actinocorallia sp. API 0066]